MAGGALSIEGERTASAIGDDVIHTGSKSFGGAMPFSEGNPYIVGQNNLKIAALLVVGVVGAIFVWKKVK